MLTFLHIRNLATVAELEMDFAPGLIAVTGETGTGKSVIMGALQALLGERAEKSIIRHGENRCEITAEFKLPGHSSKLAVEIGNILEASGIAPCLEQQLRLRRVITPSSSRAYINDSLVTLEILRSIGNLLIDIHGPHDHQSLLSPACQLDLLDAFAELDEKRRSCLELFRQAREVQKNIEQLCQITVDPAEQEIMAHQLKEIRQAEMDPEEEKQLQDQYRTAVNARTLIENASNCRETLSESDDAVIEKIRPCVTMLEEICRMDSANGSEMLDRIISIIAQTEDLSQELATYAETVEIDNETLRQIERRLEQIQRLRRKYGGTIVSVLERAEQLAERLDASEQREERLQELNRRQEQIQEQHLQLCSELSRQRHVAALKLAHEIELKLQRLGFADCQFNIEITPAPPSSKGYDRVEFSFAPNPGEGIMPLRKIVSSGEMARIMLGIKAVFSAVDQIPILVFDEVDANIGGRTANQVAREMAGIAARHQIFCITHLPQLAAVGDVHYRVNKEVADGRTITTMQRLDIDHRVNEIVRMMGGDEKSEIARKHAQNMIETGEK